jgi:1,4-alpha-glucan branching enzyme
MKWNMGWMHDTLEFFNKEPIHRQYHQDSLTFSLIYAFNENFELPLSHDEVVHGKGSLIGKMPGDDWQKRANVRLLLGYMWTHPGKKLLFMGGEIGQWDEWSHERSVDWHLLNVPEHKGLQRWMQDLNKYYRGQRALWERDFVPDGFSWVDCNDVQNNVIGFLRKDAAGNARVLVVCNFTPVPRYNYRLGVPYAGYWREALNSDAKEYGGSGQGNMGGMNTRPLPSHGQDQSISLTLPPLGIVVMEFGEGQGFTAQ